MRRVFAGLWVVCGLASAQTVVSGNLECSAPEVRQEIAVGDRPAHAMSLSQRSCTWGAGLEIEGAKPGQDSLSLFTDARHDRSQDRGYNVAIMSNGDRIFMHFVTTVETGGGNPSGCAGTFAISGGTGKFVGIYGSGKLTCSATVDGRISVRFEGHYVLPRSVK